MIGLRGLGYQEYSCPPGRGGVNEWVGRVNDWARGVNDWAVE